MVFSRRKTSVARSRTFFAGLRAAGFLATAFFVAFLTTFFVAFRAATGRTLLNDPSVA
ncbi:MAG: hypothetical protein RIQ64_882 [Actinomycetota bacterium]